MQNRSVFTNFHLMIYITIYFFFCWNTYWISDWTFNIKQGWEIHTKFTHQIQHKYNQIHTSNTTKLRLVCLQNRSVFTNFRLMIYITIDFLFCWNTYRISDWSSNTKQGWEIHTKGLSQIVPNKSRWTLFFLRSQKFLETFVRVSEITFLAHLINLLET